MKNLIALVFSVLITGFTASASVMAPEDYTINRYDGKTYIFVEGGVEFSVFADGQFDFAYVGPDHGSEVNVNVNTSNVNISFNAGHDYEMYVQYDDYGAVIQVEDVPIYYDSYGRITQAGEVDIRYNNRRIVRVGGLYVNYNRSGYYTGCTGYINVYNRFYVYRPWHVFYVRPIFASCVVYDYPYRTYYSPIRYSFYHHRSYYNNRHRVAYRNARRDFYRPGSRVHNRNGRSVANRDYNPKRRNTMVSEHGRRGGSERGIAKRDGRDTNTHKGRPAMSNSESGRNGKGRPVASTSGSQRGIAKRDGRDTNTHKGRPVVSNSESGRNGKGRPTSRPSSGREDAKVDRTKGRPVAKRGGQERQTTRPKARPQSQRVAKAERPKKRVSQERSTSRKTSTTRPQQKSRSVSRSNKTVNRNTNRAPRKAVTQRSTSTKSRSVSRGGSSNSRGRASKRGRGL